MRKLDEIQLLAFLGARDVRRDERVHECLEVGTPPLREAVANLPVCCLFSLAKTANRSETIVQALLEALDLVILGLEIIARQLEKCIRNLQHQDMWVVVLVAHQDALARTAHAMGVVVLLEATKASNDTWILLRLSLFDAKCVV